jgi:predicted RNase H-like HicB family nuclease
VQPDTIKAEWDGEAWVASSGDVPGLATGADTFEELIAKLKIVIPELLEENGLMAAGIDEVPFAVVAERVESRTSALAARANGNWQRRSDTLKECSTSLN